MRLEMEAWRARDKIGDGGEGEIGDGGLKGEG